MPMTTVDHRPRLKARLILRAYAALKGTLPRSPIKIRSFVERSRLENRMSHHTAGLGDSKLRKDGRGDIDERRIEGSNGPVAQ
jgi:hypothetical protein